MPLFESLSIIFITILVGVICKKRNIFDTHQVEGFETLLFKIAIPCYLFSAALNYKFSTLFYMDYLYAYLSAFCVLALFTLIYAVVRKNNGSEACIKILLSSYANTAVYSLPILTFLFQDPKAAILSNIIQVVMIQSIFIIILGLINRKGKNISIISSVIRSILSPNIFMPIIGLTLNYNNIIPHSIIINVTGVFGDVASSLALFIFGLSISNVKFSKEVILKEEMMVIILLKNIIHPIVAFCFGFYAFHLNAYWLNSFVIITAAPGAFIILMLARQFATNIELTRSAIAISSIVSLITLLGIIALMQAFGSITLTAAHTA